MSICLRVNSKCGLCGANNFAFAVQLIAQQLINSLDSRDFRGIFLAYYVLIIVSDYKNQS